MVDAQDPFTDTPPPGPEPGGGPAADGGPAGTGTTGAGAGRLDIQGMLNQLQGMIGKVAHASEPALREVAAKAAELAAVAADRAGPLAHTLADKTDEVGHAVAERASGLATSLRSAPGGASGGSAAEEGPDVVSDPAEDSPRDGA